VKSEQRSKLGIAVALTGGLLIAGGVFALIESKRIGWLAAHHMATDIEITGALSEIAKAECEEIGLAQEMLATSDRTDKTSQQRRQKEASRIAVLSSRVDEASTRAAQIAHAESAEHLSYEPLVEALMATGNENQEFVAKLQTSQRLRRESRTAEAERFASEVHTEGTNLRRQMLELQKRFQVSSLERLAEHHKHQSKALWWFLGLTTSALAAWALYCKYRWRQTRIELARSKAVKAPRAEHLQVARGQASRGDETELDDIAGKSLAGCRVLAAEDGPHNRRYIKRVLSKAGAEVVFAENGDDATNMVFAAKKEGEPYDVVLMDMQMPVMDGREAVKTLRRFGYQGPVVAVSSDSQDNDREQCLDAGCDAYVAKPISRDELFSAVEKFFLLRADANACEQHEVTAG
jgi:CheY-like chemotaxis protein